MILGIDTTNREKILLTLHNEIEEKCFSTKGGPALGWEFETKDQSADLLLSIEGILKKQKLTSKDLKAILVNQGPGSFTGTRVGVTVANTLAWSLNIPVYGFKEGEKEKVLAKISKLHKSKFSKIALPSYE